MKKYLLPALIAVIVLQLLAPVYMIAEKYDVLRTGQEYKFKVAPVDPYDAFRGRFVWIRYDQNKMPDTNGKYGVIEVGEDGFARIGKITEEKPTDAVYVKSRSKRWFSMPIDRYYMDEKFAPRAEELTRRRTPGKEAYVTVRIKNGKLVVSGLFVDGVAIEKIIERELE